MAWRNRGAGRREPLTSSTHKPMPGIRPAVIRRNLGQQADQMVLATPEEKAAGKLVRPSTCLPSCATVTADRRRGVTGPLRPGDRTTPRPPHGHRWGKDGTDGQLYIVQARPRRLRARPPGQGAASVELRATAFWLGARHGQKTGTGKVRLRPRHQSEMDSGAGRATCSSPT